MVNITLFKKSGIKYHFDRVPQRGKGFWHHFDLAKSRCKVFQILSLPFLSFTEKNKQTEQQSDDYGSFSSPLMHIEGFLEALTNTNKDGRIVINKQGIPLYLQ